MTIMDGINQPTTSHFVQPVVSGIASLALLTMKIFIPLIAFSGALTMAQDVTTTSSSTTVSSAFAVPTDPFDRFAITAELLDKIVQM